MEDQVLSEHFMLSEFERSSTAVANGIDNRCPSALIPNLKNLCEQVLEPLRRQAGEPIVISSGYRCPRLNRLVGGVSTSQHLTGEAVDIYTPDPSKLRKWYRLLADGVFDQLILESKGSRRWIHVSCRIDATRNRQHAVSCQTL